MNQEHYSDRSCIASNQPYERANAPPGSVPTASPPDLLVILRPAFLRAEGPVQLAAAEGAAGKLRESCFAHDGKQYLDDKPYFGELQHFPTNPAQNVVATVKRNVLRGSRSRKLGE